MIATENRTTIPQKSRKSFRTYHAPLHLAPHGLRGELETMALTLVFETVGRAVQGVLRELLEALYIEQGDDNRVLFADVVLPCHDRDRIRAIQNVNKPRRTASTDKGPKETARPQYKNAYRLEEVFEQNARLTLIFRVAERFSWTITRGENRGQIAEDLDLADATRSLQQVIMGWLRPQALQGVPNRLKAGVCQQAAQQFLSYIGLVEYGRQPSISFPSLEERDSGVRLTTWLQMLLRLMQKTEPFHYELARELFPRRYAPDDPRGDGLVNVDPDWLAFIKSPFPDPLPLNFVKANDVVVYERRWENTERAQKWNQKRKGRQPIYTSKEYRRLYVVLPIFDGVPPDSSLGQLAVSPHLGWWKSHCDEFKPLGAWRLGQKLNPKINLLVLPLEYEPDSLQDGSLGWFKEGLSGIGGRSVDWSVGVQKRKRVGEKAAKTHWEIHFATSKEVIPMLRPYVLGIHFTLDDIYWALANETGAVMNEDILVGNVILDHALEEKGRLEELQEQLRWVGDIHSAREIERRTYELARSVLALAREKNANLAIEKIAWVDKQRGGPEANRVFSMWNYAELADLIEWLGLEDAHNEGSDDNGSILTIREVSDYLVRYTCPWCGACRKAKQTRENADTWLDGNTLECRNRRCRFTGEVSDQTKAQLIARLGAARLRERLRAQS